MKPGFYWYYPNPGQPTPFDKCAQVVEVMSDGSVYATGYEVPCSVASMQEDGRFGLELISPQRPI